MDVDSTHTTRPNRRHRGALTVALLLTVVASIAATMTVRRRDAPIPRLPKVIVVAHDNAYPPFEFQGKSVDPNSYGFAIDMIREAGKILGLDIHWDAKVWSEAIRDVWKGKADVLSEMYATDDRRKEGWILGTPWGETSSVLYVRNNDPYVRLSDLAGKRIACQQQASEALHAARVYGARLQEEQLLLQEKDTRTAIKKLVDGEVEAAACNREVAFYVIAQEPEFREKLRMIDEVLGIEKYSVASIPGKEELVKQLSDAIGALKANGAYERIHMKWFLRHSAEYERWQAQRETMIWWSLGSGTVLGALLTLSYSLWRASRKARRASREALKATREAMGATREAKRANEAKTVFLANMSHDLLKPLNAINPLADLLLLDPGLSNDQANKVARIKNAGNLLLDIIKELLDLSRLEAGKEKREPEEFNIRQAIELVVSQFEPEASSKCLTLSVTFGELPGIVSGDKVKLERILLNLVGNAVKFTKVGQVMVDVSSTASDDGYKIECSVRDTGIGIPSDKLGTIFKPFEQVETSRAKQRDGMGLGLAIAARFAKLMKGDITVESEVGKGSLFRLTVYTGKPATLLAEKAPTRSSEHTADRKQEVEYRSDPQPDSVASTGRGLRCLVAEDDPTSQFVMQEFLTNLFGCSCRIVDNGKDAVELLTKSDRPFDIVFMDNSMPYIDGIEATRRIRRYEKSYAVEPLRIIALTAEALPENIQGFTKAGIDEYIGKPVAYEELARILSTQPGHPAKDVGSAICADKF